MYTDLIKAGNFYIILKINNNEEAGWKSRARIQLVSQRTSLLTKTSVYVDVNDGKI